MMMRFSVVRSLCVFVVAITLFACDKKAGEAIANKTETLHALPLYQPDIDIPELFARVQMEMIFPDTKTFVDATPRLAPAEIMTRYQGEKDKINFDLKAFVEQNFTLPAPLPVAAVKNESDMLTHLKAHWINLLRAPQKTSDYSTLIALPNPYIVPGGRFREMFYWDSYFTLVGLMQSDQDKLALDMIDNFAYLLDQYGYIPNGNRTYFLSRSQPPFFAAMLQLYAQKHGVDSITKYVPQLEKEYAFWMDDHLVSLSVPYVGKHLIALGNGDYVNRYFGSRDVPRAEAFNKETNWADTMEVKDKPLFFRNLRAACESGWDFSSRWFADGKTKASINTMDIIPVDLSSLLYSLEKTLADLYQHQQHQERADFYRARAEKRKALIQQYHYDVATGTYQDYNYVTGRHTGQLSIAMVFPLFFDVATPEAAKSVARIVQEKFLMPGGVVTTLAQTGEQWDYPNGWAPMQYMAAQGLLQYNEKTLALDIAKRWLTLNERVYREDGKMMEKYNVVDTQLKAGGGNYPNQDGFGWTNGVDIAFYHLLNTQE
jgi:alpha,alpha-trehalase